MRLSGSVFEECTNPDRWMGALKGLGYSAASCPLDGSEPDDVSSAFAKAAQTADVVIAEVGAWSNPLSPDENARRTSLALSQKRLALADKIGARCCVNIAGSRSDKWDGPHPDNLTDETFDLIIETVRYIIDAVKPTRTFYTLEPMPWMYPDSADSYLELIRAIDRKQFAVHLDPVNLVSSPQRFHDNAALIRDCFEKLGPYIRSCHAKDIRLSSKLTVHLDEVRPGTGGLDYRVYLKELNKLDPDMPLVLEHLETQEEYRIAADYVRSVAREAGVPIR